VLVLLAVEAGAVKELEGLEGVRRVLGTVKDVRCMLKRW